MLSVRSAPTARDASLALCLALGFFFLSALAVPGGVPLWVNALVGELGFVLAAVVVVVVRGVSRREGLGLRRIGFLPLVLCAGGALALHMILRATTPLVEHSFEWMHLDFQEQMLRFEEHVEGELRAWPTATVLALTLLPAFCEEILFRGILFFGYGRTFGPPLALLATSVLFGLIHILPIRVFFTFVLGLYFGYVVWKTRSLWCGVAAHGINNALVLLLPEAGLPDALLAVPCVGLLGSVLWALRRYGALGGGGGVGRDP